MDETRLDQIAQEFNNCKAEFDAVQGNNTVIYNKGALMTLKNYSKNLQLPVAMGNAKAIAVKSNIDSFLQQFEPRVAMKKEVKPLTMHNYYQNTSQFHNPFAR